MEVGLPNATGGIADEVVNLYNQLRNVSISTVFWKCGSCNQDTDIGNLWNCERCRIEFICTRCMVGRCNHKSSGCLHTVIDDIERMKLSFDEWRKTVFDDKMDQISMTIEQLASRMDAEAKRLGSLVSSSDLFFAWINSYFLPNVEELRTQVTDMKKEVTEWTNRMDNSDELLPQFSIFNRLTKNMDQRCDRIDYRIQNVDEHFSTWIQAVEHTLK